MQNSTNMRIDHYGEAVPTRTYDEEHFTANIEVDPSGTFTAGYSNLWVGFRS